MSYIIFYEQYVPLLNSGNDDVIKNAFQEIFELLVKQKRMVRSKRNAFIQDVNNHVNSTSQKVRKWAYHCACFYQDESVRQSIKTQLMTERNKENILWALTALSKTYDNVIDLKQCVGRRHEEFIETISGEYLTDALVLFGGVVKINPKTVLLTNNSADLAALTKIYAYNDLVRDKYPSVTDSIIREMEKNDDPYVREYVYWSHVLRGTKRNFYNVPDDVNDGVRKWQIAIQIKNGDEDFVVSALKPLASCPETVSFEVKSGILRGLNEISYNDKYVSYINGWYESEVEEAVVFLLIDYIIANCIHNYNDGTYFYAIKDSLNDPSLAIYVINKIKNNAQYELEIIHQGEGYTLDYKTKEGKIMQNISVSGSGNSVAFADNHSSATVISSSSEVSELTKLIQEVQNQAKEGLSCEDKQKVEEGLSFVEEEAKAGTPRKTIIKGVLDGLNAIKGTVQFMSAVADLIKFFE